MNLTDNEIMKALECCDIENKDCVECPLQNKWSCDKVLSKNALDLINRLKTENNELKNRSLMWAQKYDNRRKVDRLQTAKILDLQTKIKEQQTQIERLHEVINGLEEQSHKELLKFAALSEKYTDAKAEIENLTAMLERAQKKYELAIDALIRAKTKDIKEFAER